MKTTNENMITQEHVGTTEPSIKQDDNKKGYSSLASLPAQVIKEIKEKRKKESF